jgi:hypothetical protein
MKLPNSVALQIALVALAVGCSDNQVAAAPNCSLSSSPDAGDYYDAGICRGGLPCCPAAPPDCASGGSYPACVSSGTRTLTCACCAEVGWSCWGTN